jgi:hypothetical protein
MKKQKQLTLSHSTIDKLELLALFNKRSQSNFIECLIEKAFEDNEQIIMKWAEKYSILE